jgi:glycosyltransferase involved in cell wall biosynthesis
MAALVDHPGTHNARPQAGTAHADQARAEQAHAEPSRGARGPRVLLLTDTLADVNGVSRFIRDMGRHARLTGHDLRIVTSTRLPLPEEPNIANLVPRAATSMPAYKNLEIVAPPFRRVRRLIERERPDLLHISTPGPVGVAAWWAGRRLRIPLVGVYHTDFPAYVDHLMDDRALAYATASFMRWFYRPFRLVFTRSQDYADALRGMGLPGERLKRLIPGTDTDAFHPRFADRGIWARHGLDPRSVKCLFVGRVSLEKNMPLLMTVWRGVQARAQAEGLNADLVIVGDGPYRAPMEQALGTSTGGVHFLGFRHGEELATLYASSDLFVFTSVTDTLGQVVLEAQASAVPVLVSDQGGPKEVVRAGETGLVLPAADGRAWIEAVVSLIRDDARRAAMGRAAHAYAQTMSIRRSFEHFWAEHEAAAIAR